MIREALQFLRDRLNAHLLTSPEVTVGETQVVSFIEGIHMEPILFTENKVSCLLINIEEETVLRAPDLYRRTTESGEQLRVQPEIRLNLYILFVARFTQYEQSLHFLSLVIQYFQNHRVFNGLNAPDLSESIGQLVLELTTLPFAQQNEVWNALRTTYHPSVLYKLKMAAFQDSQPVVPPEIQELKIQVRA